MAGCRALQQHNFAFCGQQPKQLSWVNRYELDNAMTKVGANTDALVLGNVQQQCWECKAVAMPPSNPGDTDVNTTTTIVATGSLHTGIFQLELCVLQLQLCSHRRQCQRTMQKTSQIKSRLTDSP